MAFKEKLLKTTFTVNNNTFSDSQPSSAKDEKKTAYTNVTSNKNGMSKQFYVSLQ